MKETGPQNKVIDKTFKKSLWIKNCANDQFVVGGVGLQCIGAGYELAKGDYVSSAIFAGGGIILMGVDHIRNDSQKEQIIEAVYQKVTDELTLRINLLESIKNESSQSEGLAYVSLDGKEVIDNPSELLEQVESPEQFTTKIGIILEHSEKRSLNIREIETLRKTQAIIKMLPGVEEALCDKGLNVIENLNQVVSTYEEKYKENNPK